jgi:hypothetical protein
MKQEEKKQIDLQIEIVKARLKDVKHSMEKLDYLMKKAEKKKEQKK